MTPIDFPAPVKSLIAALKQLPGVGPRSAERIAVWMLRRPEDENHRFAETLTITASAIQPCKVCGFFATADGCTACDDSKRDDTQLCVVEQATDVLPLERAGVFKGRYHCLGGRLSPLDGVSPEDLNIGPLLRRIDAAPGPLEVILALGSDVEGEATAHYLASLLRSRKVRITRIAQGLPAGGGLEHADELTLTRAMQGRRNLE